MKTFSYDPLFEFKPYKDITSPNGKRVYDIDGNLYPSVTTVLGDTADKTFLNNWANRLRSEGKDPNAEKLRAAERGTKLHKCVESYLQNKDFLTGTDSLTLRLLGQLRMQLDLIDCVRLQEEVLFSHKLKLAGRCDLVAVRKDKLVVIDFKTANRVKKDEWLLDYKLQCTLYALMILEMTRGAVKIDSFIIYLVSENFGCQIVEGNVSDYSKQAIERVLKYVQKSH